MLVCPQCQFANPDHHKFCQKCGTSLTQKDCHQCGTKVALIDEACPNCGALTGTFLWAVIAEVELKKTEDSEPETGMIQNSLVQESKDLEIEQILGENTPDIAPETAQISLESEESEPAREDREKEAENPETNELEVESAVVLENGEAREQSSFVPDTASASENNLSVASSYLDSGNRYRILASEGRFCEVNQISLPSQRWLQGKVLDAQPLQRSFLDVFLEQQADLLDELETNPEKFSSFGIPKIAIPYFTLHELAPVIPELHDAWEEDNQSIILLPDRSDWQVLSDLFAQESLSILQIVYWFSEIAKLWKALARINCCQSLLIETNLRVDEDQHLGLQQLYPDPPEATFTLQDLGKLWQSLLIKSGLTLIDPLARLLKTLISGNITSIQDLRLQLQDIAEQQQGHSPVPSSENSTLDPIASLSSSESLNLMESDDAVENHEDPSELITGIHDSVEDEMSTAVLPKRLLSLVDAGLSDNGRQRNHNEDCFGIETRIHRTENIQERKLQTRGLYIVCDGMGGHAHGEIASAIAVENLQTYFQAHWQDKLPDRETIEQGIFLANHIIYQLNQQNDSHGSQRMGTTLVMMLMQDTNIAIAHVGDSRLYRVTHQWGLEQLTIDHEVGQREIQAGVTPEIAYARPDAYQLTQALGPRDNHWVKPDIQFLELHEDTLFLLCSDGLSDNDLLETHWQEYLSPNFSSSNNLEQGLRNLIDFANQYNGHDNITGILVRVIIRPKLATHR